MLNKKVLLGIIFFSLVFSVCPMIHGQATGSLARQLRPVVAANCFRLSALGHDPLQYSRHSPTGETRVHFQSQTLSRVRTHHVPHPDRPPALHRIVQEIQRSLLVR
jgi:hypothetical protein